MVTKANTKWRPWRKTAAPRGFWVSVDVTQHDIETGECLRADKCMEKVAIARALHEMFPNEKDHRVRIDAGHIKFKHGGYRYVADTPRTPRVNLMDFDDDNMRPNVRPHKWRFYARRASKIQKTKPFSPARLKQIRDARLAREAAMGTKDVHRYSFHQRVAGFTPL